MTYVPSYSGLSNELQRPMLLMRQQDFLSVRSLSLWAPVAPVILLNTGASAKSNSEMKSLADHSLGHYSVIIKTKNGKITCFIALYGSYWGRP